MPHSDIRGKAQPAPSFLWFPPILDPLCLTPRGKLGMLIVFVFRKPVSERITSGLPPNCFRQLALHLVSVNFYRDCGMATNPPRPRVEVLLLQGAPRTLKLLSTSKMRRACLILCSRPKDLLPLGSKLPPVRKPLVISLYATTSASQDVRIHDSNNQLFEDIFSFVAQFGQIPVIIAGDFQAPPMSYPAIANAVCFRSWHDPVAVVDEQGVLSRPLTFSNDGTFAGVGDACTSIDAVLVNDIAFAALHSAEVVQVFGKQHRPIKLVFDCLQSISLGSTLLKLPPSSWRDVKGICTPHLRSPGMINVRLNLISTLTRSPNGML